LCDPRVLGDKLLHGVRLGVEPLVQFPEPFLPLIRPAVGRLDFTKIGKQPLPFLDQLVRSPDELRLDLFLAMWST
jgi:hypothetical protein